MSFKGKQGLCALFLDRKNLNKAHIRTFRPVKMWKSFRTPLFIVTKWSLIMCAELNVRSQKYDSGYFVSSVSRYAFMFMAVQVDRWYAADHLLPGGFILTLGHRVEPWTQPICTASQTRIPPLRHCFSLCLPPPTHLPHTSLRLGRDCCEAEKMKITTKQSPPPPSSLRLQRSWLSWQAVGRQSGSGLFPKLCRLCVFLHLAVRPVVIAPHFCVCFALTYTLPSHHTQT